MPDDGKVWCATSQHHVLPEMMRGSTCASCLLEVARKKKENDRQKKAKLTRFERSKAFLADLKAGKIK